ncbi:hypothetical protein [Ammoniphilus sp. YIM 78166]|uniref:hypothetical protein n=1 Tax=Ammoniphilus sp. YIM 78166 TaxID=1644106 RepID=UPI00106F8071|nr:hypothetical protein [Ammoniphilus sp. YIM 78166]
MIRLQLKNDVMLSMFFDDIKGGKSSFTPGSHGMQATVTNEEFDGFLKANNLITYHNTLKGYEDGTVYGEFNTE